jgi:pimeloyl-ACP methyl ester carboxylesterase
MPFFQFDNKKVYYNQIPSKTDNKFTIPLLMLHGNSVSSKMFKSEITYFSQFFDVLVFDYIGLGQSERIDYFSDDYWFYNAQTAIALLDHLKINQVFTIGTSGGALVGLNMLNIDQSRIRALIADSFMGYGLNQEDALTIANRRTKAKSRLLEAAFWKSMNGDDWENVVDLDIDLMKRVGASPLRTILGDLTQVQTPVLCVASHQDELIPELGKKVQAVADDLQNSELTLFDFGKHPFMITQKAEFRELAMNYIHRIFS